MTKMIAQCSIWGRDASTLRARWQALMRAAKRGAGVAMTESERKFLEDGIELMGDIAHRLSMESGA